MTKTVRRRSQRGTTTLEAVLVFPVLLLLLMLIIQFALWYHATDVATAAAQDGVRAARVEGGTGQDGYDRANTLLDEAARSILQDRKVVVARTTDDARVEVSGTCIALVPFLRLPVRAVAASGTERFRAAVAP